MHRSFHSLLSLISDTATWVEVYLPLTSINLLGTFGFGSLLYSNMKQYMPS